MEVPKICVLEVEDDLIMKDGICGRPENHSIS